MRPAVLMTDPRHFAIRGGANPHTRREDDSLKVVDIERAMPQWHTYVDKLLDGGIDVYVADGAAELTGMVFAANAGFLEGRLDDRPASEKVFYPSHFTAEHRVGESALFSRFMERFGFAVHDYPDEWRFEGEADAFPVGRGDDKRWIFTFGFRSDERVGDWLEEEVVGESMIRLRLTDPRYYHGDCLLCDLGGPLLGWTGGLAPEAVARLREEFGERFIEMPDADAENFLGNSFYVETGTERLLYTPEGISDALAERIEAEGIELIEVDISEFFGKGGGGPKCMVFNLGEVDRDDPRLSDEERAFRQARHVDAFRQL
ncbi:MAG: dimethylarginine dimethylaminohydrolase family protein [Persicimonas sp.]